MDLIDDRTIASSSGRISCILWWLINMSSWEDLTFHWAFALSISALSLIDTPALVMLGFTVYESFTVVPLMDICV